MQSKEAALYNELMLNTKIMIQAEDKYHEQFNRYFISAVFEEGKRREKPNVGITEEIVREMEKLMKARDEATANYNLSWEKYIRFKLGE